MELNEFKPTIILTTTDSEENAKRLAQHLVEERLAACVSYYSIGSVYRWQNEIQHTSEFQLIVKCNGAQKDNLMQRIKELHTYDVPEILALPISELSPSYLSWMKEQL